ncbi:MAG: hypothetical protein V1738_05205 [Patescibacteria group bacterium]
MDSYDSTIAPPGGSPELPGSQFQSAGDNNSGQVSRLTAAIIAVVAGLVAAGISGGLVAKYNQPTECVQKTDSLLQQAISDKEAIRAKYDELKLDLAAAERAAMGLPSLGSGASLVRFSDSEQLLFVEQEHNFAAVVPAKFERLNDKCELDQDGNPVLTTEQGVPTKLVERPDGGYYFVSEYHYEMTDASGALDCRLVSHDLTWIEKQPFGLSLSVVEGIKDESAVRAYLRETFSDKCGELAELTLKDGSIEQPQLFEVKLSAGEVNAEGVSECEHNLSAVWFSPLTESLYFSPVGDVEQKHQVYPVDLIVF